jgi:hypothetical protein
LACPKEEGGLGFRDFQSFNMAMVAKQAWNLMHKPTSLVARMYKARYFPHNSLLDANLGNNPSFAWRSIWRSRKVLVYGCRWQIGDESKIRVMHEPWLRSSHGRCLSAPQNNNVYNLMVHHLLVPNKKEWDIEKINSLFPSEVVRDILSVPLLPLVREDKLIWSEENDGVYSVRSGYRKLMKEGNKGYGPNREEGWSSIWKIHAPPKVKHLLWRICRDCLPTRVRLRSRGVQCPEECPLCLSHDEDEWHLFFNCGAIRDAWNAMELSHIIQPRLHMFTNPKDLIFDICMQEPDFTASRTATLMWFIWQNRNNIVWNDGNFNAHQLGVQAATFWNQWAVVNGLLEEHQQRDQPNAAAASVVQWQQPPHGCLKCNVDASFFTEAASTGCGWVLRDYRGHFQLAGTNLVSSPFSVMEGEAMALIEAMEQVIQRGLSFVIFERSLNNI